MRRPAGRSRTSVPREHARAFGRDAGRVSARGLARSRRRVGPADPVAAPGAFAPGPRSLAGHRRDVAGGLGTGAGSRPGGRRSSRGRRRASDRVEAAAQPQRPPAVDPPRVRHPPHPGHRLSAVVRPPRAQARAPREAAPRRSVADLRVVLRVCTATPVDQPGRAVLRRVLGAQDRLGRPASAHGLSARGRAVQLRPVSAGVVVGNEVRQELPGRPVPLSTKVARRLPGGLGPAALVRAQEPRRREPGERSPPLRGGPGVLAISARAQALRLRVPVHRRQERARGTHLYGRDTAVPAPHQRVRQSQRAVDDPVDPPTRRGAGPVGLGRPPGADLPHPGSRSQLALGDPPVLAREEPAAWQYVHARRTGGPLRRPRATQQLRGAALVPVPRQGRLCDHAIPRPAASHAQDPREDGRVDRARRRPQDHPWLRLRGASGADLRRSPR
jgi:hypothetical protein